MFVGARSAAYGTLVPLGAAATVQRVFAVSVEFARPRRSSLGRLLRSVAASRATVGIALPGAMPMFTVSVSRERYLLCAATGEADLADLCGLAALVSEEARRTSSIEVVLDLLAVTS